MDYQLYGFANGGISTALEVQEKEYATETYFVDWKNKRIYGRVTDHEAVEQSIVKLYMTERFAFWIYSDGYGIYTEDLIGMPMEYVNSIIDGRIYDVGYYDNRVVNIEIFKKVIQNDLLVVYFTVTTVDGVIDTLIEVQT